MGFSANAALRRIRLSLSRTKPLDEAIAIEADLRNADLEGANLSSATIWRANFEGANLLNTNFEDATYIEKATFSEEGRMQACWSDCK